MHESHRSRSCQQEVETSDTESEDGSESGGSSFDSSEETTLPVQSGPPQFVQKLIVFAAGLRVLLSAIMNTAGKVVVTLLLGLAGAALNLDRSIHVCSLVFIQDSCCRLCACVCRDHAAVAHLQRVLWSVPGAGVVVGVQPRHKHAHLQLAVCDDDDL